MPPIICCAGVLGKDILKLISYESTCNIFSCDIHCISIIHRAFPVDILTVQCILSLLA